MFFQADHRRIDDSLQRALTTRAQIDAEAYAAFRAGLLRHIALEEKLLLPAARRCRGGEPLALARRLRVDHGAMALLLVPSPTPELVAEIRSILEPHDRLEEGVDGPYAICDELLAPEAEELLERARCYPEVKMAPHYDGERACRRAEQALHISGTQRGLHDSDSKSSKRGGP
jgi:hypothetical protein